MRIEQLGSVEIWTTLEVWQFFYAMNLKQIETEETGNIESYQNWKVWPSMPANQDM